MKIKIFFLIFFSLSLFGESVDNLLKFIEIKTDLSQKTKLANGGISFIVTRSDLERMQVNKLKDILESLMIIEYRESSYGFNDPYSRGDNKAFVSNNVRVFINNQEIATGMYGSGLMLLGDMDLGFADHIEIYYQNPTYEYTTEPTSVLIKIYTKTAEKDNGGKIKLQLKSYGAETGSVAYSNELEKFSYFNYFSYDDNQRKKYHIKDSLVSRDSKNFQVLSSIYSDTQNLLLEVIKQNKDSFLDTSIDDTPTKADVDTDFIHLGYDGKVSNLYFLFNVDYKLTKSDFKDDVEAKEEYNYLYPIYSQVSTMESYLYNSELKYRYKTDKNILITGLKYRYKIFNYLDLTRNGQDLPKTGNDKQLVSSIFFENQYFIKDNSIFNFGSMYSKVRNNNSKQQDNIFMFRLGNTYVTSKWIFKTIVGHTEFSIDPYLVNSTDFFIEDETVKKTKENLIYENISYKDGNNKYELLLLYAELKDMLFPNFENMELLYNYKNSVKVYNFLLNWTFDYNRFDKLFISFGYKKMGNFPKPYAKKDDKFFNVIRGLNNYKKYIFFNELISTIDNDKLYLIYNCGVKYNIKRDLILSFKGENILNKAEKQDYFSSNPETLEIESVNKISPIDRTFIVSLEYLF